MNQQNHIKICLCCKEEFKPDPRIGDKQKVCQKLACKLYRKRIAQKRWRLKNPKYFKGRYSILKQQIKNNQKSSKSNSCKISNTIQDELTICFNSLLRAMTIQDELTRKITTTNDNCVKTIQDKLTHLNSFG